MDASKKPSRGRVLAVDDDGTSLAIVAGLLEDLGYETLTAGNGREAMEVATRECDGIEAIVLDKNMPEMNGIEVVKELQVAPGCARIPVVMVTGANKPEEIKEGIDAGVFYYLTKPFDDDVFKSILTSAVAESRRLQALRAEFKKHTTSFGFLERAEFRFRKLDEAESLAGFLASCFPSPETALPGLAALFINAVEHGNLEIAYEEKSKFLAAGRWREEIERRETMPEYAKRSVKVRIERNSEETRVTITDEGKGFDWRKYLEIDPARALDNNGRGIAQANQISFDELIYQGKGNEVTAISRAGGGIKW
jgi:CheY-like chemotaxis protein